MELNSICKGFSADRREPDVALMLKGAWRLEQLLTYNSISDQRAPWFEGRVRGDQRESPLIRAVILPCCPVLCRVHAAFGFQQEVYL